MENTSERPKARDTGTMASISDGFSAFHEEVDKARANMLGSQGSAFKVERAAVDDRSQQAALDKHKNFDELYASVFAKNGGGGGGKRNKVDDTFDQIIAA